MSSCPARAVGNGSFEPNNNSSGARRSPFFRCTSTLPGTAQLIANDNTKVDAQFTLMNYNIQSAMSEGRLETLIAELEDISWNIVALTETWREAAVEKIEFNLKDSGCTFYGSGGRKRSCGVGFLVSANNGKIKFTPVNERLAFLDIKLGIKRVRMFIVYVPDSSHDEEEFEAIFETLENYLKESKRNKLITVIAGDFNAQVGGIKEHEDPSILGTGGFGNRNSRGDFLLRWCTTNGLVISNTFFDAPADAWTYRNGDVCRQLDYILLDTWLHKQTRCCKVCGAVEMGSAHRLVYAEFRLELNQRAKRERKHAGERWCVDKDAYKQQLDNKLSSLQAGERTAEQLEETMKFAAHSSQRDNNLANIGDHEQVHALNVQIQSLIAQRRRLQESTQDAREILFRRKQICKDIQKLVRKRTRLKKAERISTILHEFRGLKDIAAIKGHHKTSKITSMRREDGTVVLDDKGIADVFAEFYSTLYRATEKAPPDSRSNVRRRIEPISFSELQDALRGMKRARAKDEACIFAEMLKDASDNFLRAVLELFNCVLDGRQLPPASWKKTSLIVIFKKGDPQSPSNYRPISILPILYKLFSRILCSRLLTYVMPKQGVEQAAYRKGCSTEDHLLTVSLIIEKSWEYNVPVWFALVDFEKAFDTVEHAPLWHLLAKQGVPKDYVDLLRSLYADQVATVHASAKSKEFSLTRGVKQGDPMSALLFIAVMQACFDELEEKWAKANRRRTDIEFGLKMNCSNRNLTDLRFADDVILIAQQRSDIGKMLRDLSDHAAKFGLRINFTKTKIMTWNALAGNAAPIDIYGKDVSILDEAVAERYLGRKLCFQDSMQTELDNRIAAAWGSFHKHKSELCGKHYRLKDRVRLFEAVVTPTVLYGASTWTLRADMVKQLNTVWRKMLRYVFRCFCKKDVDLEVWIEFLRESAHAVDSMAREFGLEDWNSMHKRRKWRLAGRLARETDERWSAKVLDWSPAVGRSRGRPRLRWTDQLEMYAGGDWKAHAEDADRWCLLEEGFVKFNG